jgi:hypothetical protein
MFWSYKTIIRQLYTGIFTVIEILIKYAVRNMETFKENVNSPYLCCLKLKDKLQRVVNELKSVLEIVQILKEDQEQLSYWVDNIELWGS